MIRREKLHALILSRTKQREADWRMQLFTRQHGLLAVTAKGARRIPSRRGGHLEPLTHVIAIISGHPGNYYLAAVEPVEPYAALRADHESLAPALVLARLASRLFEAEEPQPTLFDALAHAWAILPELSPPRRHVLEVAVTLHALTCAGWLPELAACAVCGIARPTDAVIISNGSWRCLPCHSSLTGTQLSLPPELLRVIRFIARHPERALQLRLTLLQSAQLVASLSAYVAELTGEAVPAPAAPAVLHSHYGR